MRQILTILLLLTAFAPLATAQRGGDAAENRVVIDGDYFYVHTVLAGETLYSLGRKYGVAERDIVRHNPRAAGQIKAGETLRIPAPGPEPLSRGQRRRTEEHVVNTGENSYAIARRYGVMVDDLVAANLGLDPTHIVPGEVILIPRGAIGSASPERIDDGFAQYIEALNELSEGWDYHLVEQGETLWTLSRELGLPEDSLYRYNPELSAGGLRAGALLRYPARVASDIRLTVHDPAHTQDTLVPQYPWPGESSQAPGIPRPIDTSRPLHVGLMLPFTGVDGEEVAMTETYKGILLALEELKAAGISVDLSVFDTRRSIHRVEEAFDREGFDRADLIIGPWTEAGFAEAAHRARRAGIPIVSPQTAVGTDNAFVFQARPAARYQYDKLLPFLTGEYNVVMITPSSGIDEAFRDGIEPLLPAGVHRVNYTRVGSGAAIRSVLSRERDNVVIVPTTDENTTDAILSTLGSIQNNLTATTGSGYPLQVIGSSQWTRFRNNNLELFFKLQAMCTTLYYADRSAPAVDAFDRRYLAAFATLPTAYSYRGYDVAKYFVTLLHTYGARYADHINRVETPLLQVPYHFTRGGDDQWVNDQWVLVKYRNNYIIDVE